MSFICGLKNNHCSFLDFFSLKHKFVVKTICFFVLNLASFVISFSQDSTQEKSNEWEFHGNIQVNNNGISPVPAFSLGRPALMSTLAIKKGRFTFNPEYNMSLDVRPWVINEWFRYQIPKKNSYYQFGFNFSQFFTQTEMMVNSEKQISSNLTRYVTAEAMYGTKLSEHIGLRVTYWISGSLDFDGVKQGHFLLASLPLTSLGGQEGLNINVIPNLFYINNTIPFEGLFTSVIANLGYEKLPVRLFGQAVQPIKADDSALFNWNFGLNYFF
jgi:hypothetical protein